MRTRRIDPVATDLEVFPADLAVYRRPLTLFVVRRGGLPLAVDLHGASAMFAGFLVPLSCLGVSTFLVNSRGVLPCPMNAHRFAANLTFCFVPGAFLVIVRHVLPIPMYLHGATTVHALLFVPLCSLSFAAFFVYPGRLFPAAMDSHWVATNLAVLLEPGALLAVFRHITPILMDRNLRSAVLAIDGGPFRHDELL